MSSPLIPRLTAWHGAAQLHPYFVCDVFTSEPLWGNQLGVFVDGRPFTTEEMQRLAREMNFAETVFLLPPREGGDVWIRIFAPESELPFAGHPVLGTAFVVSTALGKDELALETGAGLVPVRLELRDGRPAFGRMQQPIPGCEPFERERALLDALGLTESGLPVELYRSGAPHVFVELASEGEVAALKPDFAALERAGRRRELLRRFRAQLEDTHVLPRARDPRGLGDRIGGRPARTPPCPSRADRLRTGDRDQTGRRDGPPFRSLRSRNRLPRARRVGRGRRRRLDRRRGRIPNCSILNPVVYRSVCIVRP